MKIHIATVCVLMLAAVCLQASAQELNGVSHDGSTDYAGSLHSSLAGGRPVRIHGTNFDPSVRAAEYSVFFQGSHGNIQGPSLTNDQDFQSSVEQGFIYYDTPHIDDIVDPATAGTVTSYSAHVNLRDTSNTAFACPSGDNCQISYSQSYTPQLLKMYPSTFYSGQDICFEVFTDQVTTQGPAVTDLKIGDYYQDVSTHQEDNLDKEETYWNSHQCAVASGNAAQSNYDISLFGYTGAYQVSEFARSSDGSSQYVARAIPKVEAIYPFDLNPVDGTIIGIAGEGFSSVASENVVDVEGNPCTVLEASENYIRCQLSVTTSDYSAITEFAGGAGGHGIEYDTIVSSQIPGTTVTPVYKHFTDMVARVNQNDIADRLTRTVEAWFVAPQDGSYIFHGSCDDACYVSFSTTPDDKSAATSLFTATDIGFGNFWNTDASKSDPVTLVGGEKYFISVRHDDYGWTDLMQIGFTIDDDSTPNSASGRGWTKLTIDPQHVFESFVLELPANPDVSYKIQFESSHSDRSSCSVIADADIIMNGCDINAIPNNCPCVSGPISDTTSADSFEWNVRAFFDGIEGHGYYGQNAAVTKEDIETAGVVTGYRYTYNLRYALTAPSFDGITVFELNNSDGSTRQLTQGSDFAFAFTDPTTLTHPLQGNYQININDGSSDVQTVDVSLGNSKGQILRRVLDAYPTLNGLIEIRESYENFLQGEEGRELYYRTTASADAFTLTIIDSPTTPLEIPNFVGHPILIDADSAHIPTSNKPFYEVIPAAFLRTVEDTPQVTVTTNGLLGACPVKGDCGFEFNAAPGTIDTYTFNSDYTELTIMGSGIPTDTVEYVSLQNCICDLHPSYSVTATEIHCIMRDCPSGDYTAYVQTANGALADAGANSVTIPIVVSNIIPTVLYQSGGQTLTITGTNFPSSFTEANALGGVSVTFSDGNFCFVTSVTTTEIQCISPAGLSVGSIEVTIAFNGQTYTHTGFTVTAPAHNVLGIDKDSISPVEKQDLVISADSQPSTNLNEYHGLLVSSDKIIKMKVNDISPNSGNFDYTVRFPGAPKGDIFNVYLVHNDQRFASLQTLSTETTISDLTIEGETGNNVSVNGGNIIVLDGTAFSTDPDDMIAVVGTTVSEIIDSTGTQIRVRAPSHTVEEEKELTLFQKPNIEVTCSAGNSCMVNYVADGQSVTTDRTNVAVAAGVVTIDGSNFGANAKGFIGNNEQTTMVSTDSQVQIFLDNVPDPSDVDLVIRTDGPNIPDFTVASPLVQSLSSISPNTGSIGGQSITLYTVGLGTETTSNIQITDSSGQNLCMDGTISQVSSVAITCITDGDVDFSSGVAFRLSFSHTDTSTGRNSQVTLSCANAADCTFTSDVGLTPVFSVDNIMGTELSATVMFTGLTDASQITLYHGMASSVAHTYMVTSATATFADGITPGDHLVRAKLMIDGNTIFSQPEGITLGSGDATGPGSAVSCSFAGGCEFPITIQDSGSVVANSGLKTGAAAGDVTVTVCGNPATFDLDASTHDNLVVLAPSYVNTYSQETYSIVESGILTGTLVSNSLTGSLAFDGVTTNKVTGTGEVGVGYDFGTGNVAQLSSVRYFMGQMIDKQTNCADKVHFQSSTDGVSWINVFTGDREMRKGWNTYEFTAPLPESQYFRLAAEDIENCPIVELEMNGNTFISNAAVPSGCDVEVTLGQSSPTVLSDQVAYTDGATSYVTDISPRYGGFKGGDVITITGDGFDASNAQTSFLIDGVSCTIQSVSTTQITCETQARPAIVANPTTVLSFSNGVGANGLASMQGHTFTYANDWSDPDTWGKEYAPQDGESVVIPEGQMLLVDIDHSPHLNAIIVQGALVFPPDTDKDHERTFDANYIFVDRGAVFEAGTEDERYTSKLTITMHGTREDTQIPTYGNKGIFVRHAQFDMHGAHRNVTWTELSQTLLPTESTIHLMEHVDWEENWQIAIASTDFSNEFTEVFTIATVDNSQSPGSVITLKTPAERKHYSDSVSYTGVNGVNPDMTKTLTMRAEVGLLTRNVVYKGADDDSVENQYGAHIMLHSPGDQSLTGRISYVELTQVGQAFQLGRYPIHFHMIGTVHGSYIKGNAIHHTYNRACTIHGVHYLTIEENVAFQTMGHTFFIEDAAETNNYLRKNLAMKTKRSWSLLNTDQTPASFWITHPNNYFIDNHAAGSDKYGFWFDLQTHATGPSSDEDICPEYEKLGEFTGNVAHSNGKYGLRFFHRYTPVEDPCAGLAAQEDAPRDQPMGDGTTPVVTHFRDFTTYKNNRSGLIGEEFGALKFHNIATADNLFAGIEFGITAAGPWLSETDDYQLQDALIVGASDNAELHLQSDVEGKLHDIGHDANEGYGGTRGIKGARTEKMRIKDVIFANFDKWTTQTGSGWNVEWSPIGTCSHCEGPGTDSSGRTYFFKNTYFIDSPRRVMFDEPYKEIIYDEDGTLGNGTHRWIVHYFKHLEVPQCERNEGLYNGLLCDDSISIRRLVFHAPEPYSALKNLPIKILNLFNPPTLRRNLADCAGATTSVTREDIRTHDLLTYQNQQDLLTAYNDVRVKTEQRDANITALEDGTGGSMSNINTLNAEITAAEAEIARLEPIVESETETNVYDELWKTDSQF